MTWDMLWRFGEDKKWLRMNLNWVVNQWLYALNLLICVRVYTYYNFFASPNCFFFQLICRVDCYIKSLHLLSLWGFNLWFLLFRVDMNIGYPFLVLKCKYNLIKNIHEIICIIYSGIEYFVYIHSTFSNCM